MENITISKKVAYDCASAMVDLNDIIVNGHLSNANERILKCLQEQLKAL